MLVNTSQWPERREMESKLNPNPQGCLAKALPDEPFFVLLARDCCAQDAIRFWADQRAQLGVEGDRRQDAEQLTEALETAEAMEQWREANEGRWRGEQPTWGTEAVAEAIESLLCAIVGTPVEGQEGDQPFAEGMLALELALARRILACDPTDALRLGSISIVARHVTTYVRNGGRASG